MKHTLKNPLLSCLCLCLMLVQGAAAAEQTAQSHIDRLTAARTYAGPIVTQVLPLQQFYPAEDYHQNYLARHPNQPYIVIHDQPKLEQLRRKFPELYR